LLRNTSGTPEQHGEEGILTALQASLEDLKKDGPANAASTIANLALRPEIQDALSKEASLSALMDSLRGCHDDCARRFICMALTRVASRRDLAVPLVETKGLVKLLLDISEETQSKGGLWRLSLRVIALLGAFARQYFLPEPGEWGQDPSPRAHLGQRERNTDGGGGGGVQNAEMVLRKIDHWDRMRMLFGLKRMLDVDQTELQTDAMQALVPWTRHKEHVMQLSAIGDNVVML
jgi:hypothetical protein